MCTSRDHVCHTFHHKLSTKVPQKNTAFPKNPSKNTYPPQGEISGILGPTMAIPRTVSATRKHVQVKGVVQGVGFRPFVYKLAQSLELTGYVFNSSSGVTIEIEGGEPAIDEFLRELNENPPQLAEITDITVSRMEALGGGGFSILPSREEAGAFALVSPDAGTCNACWRDFGDPMNRRYGYPFTNCTHCGPRYSIIHDIPYDRATTTMAAFTMCHECKTEYDDPNDRRFHAQPNACGVCGPSLALIPRGSSLAECSFADKDSLPTIHKARMLLRDGKILAVKGLGGFLLACDARNDAAVTELRKRKQRPVKPFALMSRDIAAVKTLCEVSAEDEAALLHLRRSIVILPRLEGAELASGIAPGNRTLGVMLPYTPLHYLLFSDSPDKNSEFQALVMTSGNLSEEPIVVSNAEAMIHLDGIADWFLLHNRDIAMRVDDSVVRTFEGLERVLRRSRGFVPQTIDLGIEMEEVLAFGSELKNTFCLTNSRYAILSQHIGDLENYETMRFFEETLANMEHLFKVVPRVAAHDLHPGYMSTRMAFASDIERKIGVQHHHAHIVSCMAENHLRGDVIGVAFDGTGFGTDGKIWGGEFMVADFAAFSRRGHLRYVLLPGGDAAIRQPWRMALSYLRDTFGLQMPGDLECFRAVAGKQVELVDTMISRQIQTVQTSSAGRLFDAVAAMVGLASEMTFEGQPAIALEMAAVSGIDVRYPFEVEDVEPMILDFRPMMEAIMKDISAGKPRGEISACFHNTLGAAIVEMCCRIRQSDGLDRVCLSGGTFQNLYLLNRTVVELRRRGFGVFLHAVVPANDGGISLGQAVIANERMRRGD
jgi:hydrogenase maturation protein HypF